MVDASNGTETADSVLFNKWERFDDRDKCSNTADYRAVSDSTGDESRGSKVALLNGETQSRVEYSDSPQSSLTKSNKSVKKSEFETPNGIIVDANEQNGSLQLEEKKYSPLGLEIQNLSSNHSHKNDTLAPQSGSATDQNTCDTSKTNQEKKEDLKSISGGTGLSGDSSVQTELTAVSVAANDQTVTTPNSSKFSRFDKSNKTSVGSSSANSSSKNWITFEDNNNLNIEKTTIPDEKPREISNSNMALLQSNISHCDKNALVEEIFSSESEAVPTSDLSTENDQVASKSELNKRQDTENNFEKKAAVLTVNEHNGTNSTLAISTSNTGVENTISTTGKLISSSPKTWVNFDDDNTLLETAVNKDLNKIKNKGTSSVGDASERAIVLSESIREQPTKNVKAEIPAAKQTVTTNVTDVIMSKQDGKATPAKDGEFTTRSGIINSSGSPKQWVSFEESSVISGSSENSQIQGSVSTKGISTTTSSFSAVAPSINETTVINSASQLSSLPTSSWVSFNDESNQKSELRVAIPMQHNIAKSGSSTPSPNPFLNAPKGAISNQEHGINPFTVPAEIPLNVVTNSNPFKPSDNLAGAVGKANPFQASAEKFQPLGGLSAADLDILEGISSTPLVNTNNLTPTPQNKTQQKLSEKVDKETEKAISIVSEEKVLAEKDISESDPTLDDLPFKSAANSWTMLLRYPDKKKKIGSRDWKPVVIRLEGSTLQFYEEYELSAPFREIPLQACFAFSDNVLQKHYHHKVHTVKLEYVKYKESRKVRKGGDIEHIAVSNPIIKVGSPNHLTMKHFTEAVSESLCTLPAYRDRGITYSHDEVFVDIDDTCEVLSDGNGTTLKQAAKVQIKLRAFLTGDPECQLVLNDVAVKEREEARLRGELKPQRVHHWVKLCNTKFHKCVNPNSFTESHSIMFHPLDACTFELMRFRVPQTKQLPLLVKASLNVHNEQRVELKAEIQVCQDAKLAKYERNNIVFRFPIPDSWVSLLRTNKPFGGEKSIKSSRGRKATGIKGRLKNSKCSMAASLGTAKYEPEYGAIMWRIEKLPLIQSKIPADAPHTLTCRLELPAGMDFPDHSYEPYAELSYDIAYVLVSDTTVIAVKVSNQNIPEKWVCYRSFYHHHIKMTVSRPNSGPIRDVGCSQQ